MPFLTLLTTNHHIAIFKAFQPNAKTSENSLRTLFKLAERADKREVIDKLQSPERHAGLQQCITDFYDSMEIRVPIEPVEAPDQKQLFEMLIHGIVNNIHSLDHASVPNNEKVLADLHAFITAVENYSQNADDSFVLTGFNIAKQKVERFTYQLTKLMLDAERAQLQAANEAVRIAANENAELRASNQALMAGARTTSTSASDKKNFNTAKIGATTAKTIDACVWLDPIPKKVLLQTLLANIAANQENNIAEEAFKITRAIYSITYIIGALESVFLKAYSGVCSDQPFVKRVAGVLAFFNPQASSLHDRQGMERAIKQVQEEWSSQWQNETTGLRALINQTLIPNINIPGTPIINPNYMINTVLDKAMQYVVTMLLTLEMPAKPDAHSWCIFLFSYATLLGALRKPFDPDFIAHDKYIGKQVSYTNFNLQVDASWAFDTLENEWAIKMADFFKRVHTQNMENKQDRISLGDVPRLPAAIKAIASLRKRYLEGIDEQEQVPAQVAAQGSSPP